MNAGATSLVGRTALGLALAVACRSSPSSSPAPAPSPPSPSPSPSPPAGGPSSAAGAARPTPPGGIIARRIVETHGHVGLSDLAFDPGGGLWSIAERQRALLPIEVGPSGAGLAGGPVEIVGIPEAYDTEAMAWLDGETVAIGTETQVPARQSDDIFLARVSGGVARVVGRRRMDYALWGMRAESNRGIEGMCAAAGLLVAAGETAARLPDGRRAAPLGRLDLEGGGWTPFWLPLFSATGRISALACRPGTDGESLTLWAVERHFGVTLLVTARLPRGGAGGVLAPTVWSDLAAATAPRTPNLEGIAQSRPGASVFLITDNHFGRVTGPNELFEVAPPAP